MRSYAALETRQQATRFLQCMNLYYYTSGPPHDAGGSWTRIDNLSSKDRIIECIDDQEVYADTIEIVLDNSDSAFDAYSLEGLWICFGWGAYDTDDSTPLVSDYNDTPPPPYFWVKKQWFSSDISGKGGGKDRFHIYGLGPWSKLAEYFLEDDHDTGLSGDALYNLTIKDAISAILDEAGMFLGTSISECSNVDNANWKPIGMTISAEDTLRTAVIRYIRKTKCVLIPRADGMVLKELDSGEAKCYDYNSSAAHFIKEASAASAMFRPAKVTVEDITGAYTYTETHTDWQAGMGEMTYIDEFGMIDSSADAQFMAEAIVNAAESQADSGTIVCRRMNCLQEIHDVVEATDSMGNTSATGRVGRILRHYERYQGVYDMTIALGGLLRNPRTLGDMIDATGILKPISGQLITPWSIDPMMLRKTMQPYVVDIAWSSSAYNKAAWAAGTITFADGTSQSITTSGSPKTLTATHFAYFIQDNTTIQWSTDFTDTIGKNRGLLAVCVIGDASDGKALILPANGKEPVINANLLYADIILAQHIKAGEIGTDHLAAQAVTVEKSTLGPANLLDDPGFEISNLESAWKGWTENLGTSFAYDSDAAKSRGSTNAPGYAYVSDDGDSSRLDSNLSPVIYGENYTASVYIKTLNTPSVDIACWIRWYDKDKAYMNDYDTAFTITAGAIAAYTLYEGTVQAPQGACYAAMCFRHAGSGTANAKYYIDDCCFNKGSQTIMHGTPGGAQVIIGPNPIDVTQFGIFGFSGAPAAGTLEFYLDASDGKGYFGGGTCTLEKTGLLITGSGATYYIKLEDVAQSVSAYMYIAADLDFRICTNDTDIDIVADGDLTLDAFGGTLYIGSSLGVYIERMGFNSGECTIDSGSIEYSYPRIYLDTEGDAASDNLDEITNYFDTAIVILSTINNTRDVTVRHNGGGTGNICLAGGADFTLSNRSYMLMLQYYSAIGLWCEISRSANPVF